jgi:hypothetical protein
MALLKRVLGPCQDIYSFFPLTTALKTHSIPQKLNYTLQW